MSLQFSLSRVLAASILLGSLSVASADIIVPSVFNAKVTGFTTYADGQFTLASTSGVTVGGGVFVTLTPTTVEVGLTQQGFANFNQAFNFSLTGLQLPGGQAISGLTVINNERNCCSTSTSFTSNSLDVIFDGTDTRNGADTITYQINFTPPSQAPEPATWGMFACGMAALAAYRFRRA